MIDATEKGIIVMLATWLDHRKFPFQMPNAFIYGWECDYWAMTSDGETREFEIKISKADFLNDAKKKKHSSANGANYFYYVCPDDLIKPIEVDKRYGLIYVSSNRVQIIKKPRRLNDNKFGDWKMLANKMYWKWWSLWLQKYRDKEISRLEYLQGFSNESLFLEETIDNKIDLFDRNNKISLLENYSTFLAANGYMDEDWRSEPPYAIDEFLKLTQS